MRRHSQRLSAIVSSLSSLNASSSDWQLSPKAIKSAVTDTIGSTMIIKGCIHPCNTTTGHTKGNLHILSLPEVVLAYIMSYIVNVDVDIDSFLSLQLVCTRFNYFANSNDLWHRSSHVLPSGALNLNAFRFVKEKCKGTEGACYHGVSRMDKREYAIKRARVYPKNEGIPYYMTRELAALKKIKNKHICELQMINLYDFKLHLLFPYIEKNLHDYMNPLGGTITGAQQMKKVYTISVFSSQTPLQPTLLPICHTYRLNPFPNILI